MWNAESIDVGLHGSAPRYGDLCVHAVVDLRRSFTREDLERATRATVESFPVLGCVYETRFFRDRWTPAKVPLPEMVRGGETGDLEQDTEAWTRRNIDPTRERSLRVALLPTPHGCRLVVSLSHLAVDGAGMAAVGHVLGSHLYGVAPALPVERRRDLRRALDGLSLFHVPVLVRDTITNLINPFRVYRAARRERHYPSDGSTRPSSRQVVFEADEIEAVRRRCGARVSVNDLLLAVVARVGAGRSSGGPVAALYTMDLRRFSRAPHLSATNASTILTTLVPRAATRDLATTVQAVAEITKGHRNSLVGPAFVLLPAALVALGPHAIARRLVPGIHPVTVDLSLARGLIFTNVGRLDHGLGPFADDIVDLRVVGPNVRGVDVPAIIAFGLRGRLHLELFAPPGLGEAALDELEREVHEALEVRLPLGGRSPVRGGGAPLGGTESAAERT